MRVAARFSLRFCVSAVIPLLALRAQTLDRAETLWRLQDYQGANAAFRELVKAHPANPDYRVRWGRLFLERFNSDEAAQLFQEALAIQPKHPGALLGLALVAADGFEAKAAELAEQALESDPKLIEARVLLARLALEDNNPQRAAEEAGKALATSPHALDAMAIHASIDWLNDRADTPWIGRILQQDPHYGRAYELAGHFFVLNRRYEEGIAYYRKALELQPDLWSARSQLGINLMRLGLDQEARAQLVDCWDHHYQDAATKNTLTLLDSYKNFVTFETGNVILRLHKKEAELLRPYFEAELKRALAAYEKKYGFKLERPVRLEVYPDHEDFAVRTMGMPGLGALGVTFGYVVAMDSPSGRKPGSFHWASTMWHELSHVYVLSATHHRVPRWFTEGMAVYEETAVSPEWGDRIDPQVISAIKNKKLLPVAELDRGFVHPTYPSQVVVSYFEAGRICGFIAKEWGYDKLLAMMHDFAANTTTAQVIEKELGMKPAEFDQKFMAALDTETHKTVEGFEDWRASLKQVAALARAGQNQEVIDKSSASPDVYPDYVEPGNLYEFRADAFLGLNNKPAAILELERYMKIGGRSPDRLKKLAELLVEAGRPADAAAVLDRINYIDPIDQDLHVRLGDLWFTQDNLRGAIREYRAVLAGNPVDPAAAHLNLARAYRRSGQTDAARDELVLALEVAPGYRPAQKMLLELTQSEQGK
ncbi:MAG TPA: tetratricopeptide repeat protein [Bryobacteraceae bacterium]|nr:tetratricopeptide repeat protein [Bryobacteraceae bacterium]